MSHGGHFGGGHHDFGGHHDWHAGWGPKEWAFEQNLAADGAAGFLIAEALQTLLHRTGQPGGGAQQSSDAGAATRPTQVAQTAQDNVLPNTQVG